MMMSPLLEPSDIIYDIMSTARQVYIYRHTLNATVDRLVESLVGVLQKQKVQSFTVTLNNQKQIEMASVKVAVLMKADYVKLPSISRQPKEAEVYDRQEKADRNIVYQTPRAEHKLLKARWQKMQEENQTEVSARKFNQVVFRQQIDRENQALVELKSRKQKMRGDEEQRSDELGQSRLKEALRWEQEKVLQSKLLSRETADFHVWQMKEREQLRAQERLQDQKDAEILRGRGELYAQERRRHAEIIAESRKSTHKNMLEDISRRNLNMEREAEALRKEDERAKLLQRQMEEKLQRKKAEEAERLRKKQIEKEIILENRARLEKEKAAIAAVREEQRLAMDLAKREAELARRQMEKELNKAAMLQSISTHRQGKILEKRQKESEERRRSEDWLEAQKEGERLFLAGEKLKFEKIREENIKLHNFNASLAAEKHARLQQVEREDREAAVRNAGQAVFREKQVRHYILHDLSNAADNLNLYEERRRLAAKDATSGRLGSPFRAEESKDLSPLPSYSTTNLGNIKQIRFATAPATSKLPPIRTAVK
ncbi:trichohyalin-like [Centropristis striata]|uniref:trichohyalin-like n=1 Tax=Centropristis striata TaxID=184440 RepID=UPI0027DF2381|nr:trichohyalin-like [Centropristis striata]